EPDGHFSYEEVAVLWYAPGTAPDYLWTDLEDDGGTLAKSVQALDIDGTYVPVVGDFDRDRCSDILWYGVGTAPDLLWWGGETGFTPGVPISVSGSYRPVSGFFGGAAPGVFWYAPNGAESVWRGTGNRAQPFASAAAKQVSGRDYQPVGYYDAGSLVQQILWYTPGAGADAVWAFTASGAHAKTYSTSLPGTYRTAACGSRVYLHAPGAAADYVFSSLSLTSQSQLGPLPISGSFRVASSHDTYQCTVVWHAPGSAPDAIWLPFVP
ncbi:MAG: hypothetical protein ABL966_12675, partial [Acidimicrobiales bacterium]